MSTHPHDAKIERTGPSNTQWRAFCSCGWSSRDLPTAVDAQGAADVHNKKDPVSDKWIERVLKRAQFEARCNWGNGWGHLAPEMRRAEVALRVMAAIAGLDESGDSAERANRIRNIATLVVTDPAFEAP